MAASTAAVTSAKYHHNQLLFNLGVLAAPGNMAVKFRNPDPLIVEKFGPTLTPMSMPSAAAAVAGQPAVPVRC